MGRGGWRCAMMQHWHIVRGLKDAVGSTLCGPRHEYANARIKVDGRAAVQSMWGCKKCECSCREH